MVVEVTTQRKQPTWDTGEVMTVRPAVVDAAQCPLSAVSLASDHRRVQLTTHPRRVRVYLRVGASHRCHSRHFHRVVS